MYLTPILCNKLTAIKGDRVNFFVANVPMLGNNKKYILTQKNLNLAYN